MKFSNTQSFFGASSTKALLLTTTCCIVVVAAAGGIINSKKDPLSPLQGFTTTADAVLKVPRGGGEVGNLLPFDTMLVAKVASALCFLQGALFKFCPTPTLDAFKVSKTPTTNFISNRLGATYLSFAVAIYTMIVGGGSIIDAMKYSSMVMLCELIFSRINNDSKIVGFDSTVDMLASIFYIAIIYGSYVNVGDDFLDTTIKAYGIFVVAVRSLLALNPMKMYELFGTTATTNGKKQTTKAVPKDELLFVKSLGYVGLGVGIFIVALTMFDVKPTQAVGYGWIPQLVFNLSGLFVTNEVDDLKLNKNAYYMWLVFHALIIGTLVF